MMERGLSDKLVSQLLRIKIANAQDDTDLAILLDNYLDNWKKKQDFDSFNEVMKTTQAFINPDIFNEVYEDEIAEAKRKKLKEIAPTGISGQDLDAMLKNFTLAKPRQQ